MRVRQHPLFWVPSLYFAMGIPNATVAIVSAIMYKNLGYSNETIVLYTSQMYLPWVLKPLWAPFLEPYKTKRFWVLSMELLMALVIGLIALSLPLEGFFRLSLAFFWIVGFASATQDIAADAVFLTTMDRKRQARYAGLMGLAWNSGAILTSGVLVSLTGTLHDRRGYSWVTSWMVVMGIIAVVLAACWLWHYRYLPSGEPSHLHGKGMLNAFRSLTTIWASFFRKDRIWLMLTVCFFYRFGEGFIERLGPLFLIDSRAAGGLALDNASVGHIYGSLGTLGLISGAMAASWWVARSSLQKTFLWLALALNVPHLTYYLLSITMPHDFVLISVLVTIEKFGYGFGSVGHMLYMMQQIAPGEYKMSHYAFATGVMAATRWATGTVSGLVFGWVGQNYEAFFLFVMAASIPPVLLALIAPFPHDAAAEKDAPAGH